MLKQLWKINDINHIYWKLFQIKLIKFFFRKRMRFLDDGRPFGVYGFSGVRGGKGMARSIFTVVVTFGLSAFLVYALRRRYRAVCNNQQLCLAMHFSKKK